jgi:hypothetical protein
MRGWTVIFDRSAIPSRRLFLSDAREWPFVASTASNVIARASSAPRGAE